MVVKLNQIIKLIKQIVLYLYFGHLTEMNLLLVLLNAMNPGQKKLIIIQIFL